jgi:hypothetical protein
MHICLAIFELPKPLLHSPLIHYTWHINTTILSMNFSCSKILLHSKTVSLQGFKNWWDFWLSCSTEIDVIQQHAITSGCNCNVWLHNEPLILKAHLRIWPRDFRGYSASSVLLFECASIFTSLGRKEFSIVSHNKSVVHTTTGLVVQKLVMLAICSNKYICWK